MAEREKKQTKQRRENNPTVIGLTQFLDPQFWNWGNEAESERLRGGVVINNRLGLTMEQAQTLITLGRADLLGDYVVTRIEHRGDLFGIDHENHSNIEVEAAYAIIHDKDEREVWSEAQQQTVTELKPPHIHMVIRFKDRQASAPLAYLAKRAGVEGQYLEKPGRGAHAYDNMLAYLTHIKYTRKHQYDPSEVVTLRGRDYQDIYAEHREAWFKGRAHVKKKQVAEDFEDFREKVLQGDITRAQIMLTDELYDIYARHQREVEDALSAYGQRRAYRAAAKLRNGDFSTHVVFIHGEAGVGKTRFAQDFIHRALTAAADRGERWQLYRAATTNPLDDWRGEEVMLLDDLRASAMDANDWLLLLDPHNASPAKARYKNKGEVAPRLIVITATIEPVEFFFYARQKGNVDEALDQFIRRLAATVKVFREDDVLRYQVGKVGQIQPYKRQLTTLNGPQSLSLSYGTACSATHSADGAAASLLLDLGERSSDVGFLEAAEWSQLETVVTGEVEQAQIVEAETEQTRIAELEEAVVLEAERQEIAKYDRIETQIDQHFARQQREERELVARHQELEQKVTRLRHEGLMLSPPSSPWG